MANRNNTARKPANEADTANEASMTDIAVLAFTEETASQPKSGRKSIFDTAKDNISSDASLKVRMMTSARQRLAEAVDLFNEGDGKSAEAQEIASQATLTLYQGRTKGLIGKDEVSAILGDQFGYKETKEGKPSKTPAGNGEVLRKRIVRLANAYDYAFNDQADRFFEGLPVDEVKSILLAVDTGDRTVNTAYVDLGELKRDYTFRINPAFDPAKVAKQAEVLAEEGAIEALKANPALVTAYAALIDVLKMVGEAAAE